MNPMDLLKNMGQLQQTVQEAQKKLKFIEERVKTWVSDVIDGHDGLSVQANLLGKRVDGLIRGIQGLDTE